MIETIIIHCARKYWRGGDTLKDWVCGQDGFQCKECVGLDVVIGDPEITRARRRRAHYIRHKEVLIQKAKEYKAQNVDKTRAYHKEYNKKFGNVLKGDRV